MWSSDLKRAVLPQLLLGLLLLVLSCDAPKACIRDDRCTLGQVCMSGRCVDSANPFRGRATAPRHPIQSRRVVSAPGAAARRMAARWGAAWALQLQEPISAIEPQPDARLLWTLGLHGWLNAIDARGQIHFGAQINGLGGVLAAPQQCGERLVLAGRHGTLVLGSVGPLRDVGAPLFEERVRLELGGPINQAAACAGDRALVSAGALVALAPETTPAVAWLAVSEGQMLATARRGPDDTWLLPTSTGEVWGFSKDGSAARRLPLSAASDRPILPLPGDAFACGDDLGTLTVFEPDGRRRFAYRFLGGISGGPTLTTESIWVGTRAGVVGKIGLDGRAANTWSGGSQVSAGPLAIDGGVIVGFRSGLLRRFNALGQPVTTLDLEAEITGLSRWHDQILASTAQGQLVAFTPDRFGDTH